MLMPPEEQLPQQPADIFSSVDPVAPSPASAQPPVPGTNPPVQPPVSSRSMLRSRLPLLIGGVVVLGGIALAGYAFFFSGSAPEPASPAAPEQPAIPAQPDQPNAIPPAPLLPLDSDGDGLPDDAEIHQYGTNPQATDTDNDGLSDREEITIYASDPKNPDTDGDTFLDGAEVSRGYNPKGPGRLFDIPQK